MVKRTILFIVLCAIIWGGSTFFYSVVQPEQATQLSIAALNGGNAEAANLRVAHQINNEVSLVAAGLTLGAGLVCYGAYIKRGITAAKKEFSNA